MAIVYCCSKVINRLRENKSGLQTSTEDNTLIIKGKKNKQTTETLRCNKQQMTMQHTQKRTIR